MQGEGTRLPVDQQLHAAGATLHLRDLHDGAHRVQVVGLHLVTVLALRDGEHAALAREGGLDCLQSPRTARRDRHGGPGEDHRLPEREDGKCQTIGHMTIILAFEVRVKHGRKVYKHFPCQSPYTPETASLQGK